MKKYILLFTIVLTGIFTACDYNDKFHGLDDLSKPINIINVDHTIVDANIATIVKALNAKGNAQDSATAKILNADKMFSSAANPKVLIPYVLKESYYSADVKSTANVTYQYKEGRDSIVTGLSTKSYELTAADYKLIWGDTYVETFTPAKSPEKNIPTILASQYKNAKKGTFKNVEYYYSKEEPTDATVQERIFFENFESQKVKEDIALNGWINKDMLSNRTWQAQTFSNNIYAQASSNKSGNKNDIWLITPSINLTKVSKPQFSFDINVRYYNGDCFSVWISDNFDGNQANIESATWKNVSNSFKIPSADMTAIASAGTMNLNTYTGKKIHIAFRYQGDDSSETKKTTTYQVDNINVSETKTGVSVKEKTVQYAAYECMGNDKWQPAAASVLSLQPADYSAMGITYMPTAEAPNFLPDYLRLKFVYAQKGDSKVIVYKTNKTDNYADQYIFDGTNWSVNTFILVLTDQFVLSKSGWVFDPTLHDVLQKGKADTDGYMMVVNYVKSHQAINNPALINTYGDSEYYYGFSANNGNVTYRDKDRSFDPLYPSTGTLEEKVAFMDARTIEGVILFLTLKYPTAQAEIGGIEQKALVTLQIFSNPLSTNTREDWVYEMQCMGDKQWKFIQRTTVAKQ